MTRDEPRSKPITPSGIYRRRPWREAPLVALDFETTGLDLKRDAIVSFGAVPIVGGRVVLGGSLYREVAPAAPLSHESIAIHELRPVDLIGAIGPKQTREILSAALDRRFVVAWVAEVEVSFLARLFRTWRWAWARRTIDAARLYVALERIEGRTPLRSVSLVEACHRHGVPVGAAHNAFDDAAMTAQLFLVIATKLAATGYYPTLRSLLRENGRRRPYEL